MRPCSDANSQVAQVMNLFGVDEKLAKVMLDFAEGAYDSGVLAGQEQAQRHLRLLLGVETPDPDEAAYWTAPFPLRED